MTEKNIALIFAGGVGQRMRNGATPKQFLEIDGKAIITYTLEVFEQCDRISDIAVVCVSGWEDYLQKLIDKDHIQKVRFIVTGGKNPQESQFIGMKAIASHFEVDQKTVVLLHDGVRPLIDKKTICDNIDSVQKYGSAITITPAIETIVSIDSDNSIQSVARRSDFMMAKAPQSYLFEDVFNTYKVAFSEGKIDFIDSSELMHHYGKNLKTVEGSTNNIKITTPVDYYIFKAIREAQSQENIFGL